MVTHTAIPTVAVFGVAGVGSAILITTIMIVALTIAGTAVDSAVAEDFMEAADSMAAAVTAADIDKSHESVIPLLLRATSTRSGAGDSVFRRAVAMSPPQFC
jgi:hypothetical protein